MDKTFVAEAFRQRLKSYPIKADGFYATVGKTRKGGETEYISIGWGDARPHMKQNHFSINIVGHTCYLLDIYLQQEYRGVGHGSALYSLLEDAATECGCTRFEQTPSGWVYIDGKMGCTRAEYLQRRGYILEGNVAFKTLYPEHAKMAKISDKSQAIGDFLEHLAGQGILLCRLGEHDQYHPVWTARSQMLAGFFNIDLKTIAAEKDAMLADLRRQHERQDINDRVSLTDSRP